MREDSPSKAACSRCGEPHQTLTCSVLDSRESELRGSSPRLPIELAIAEDALESEAREFVSELVDVRSELLELIDSVE